jgi:hypothetical protein
MLSDERRAKIERALANITQGEWFYNSYDSICAAGYVQTEREMDDRCIAYGCNGTKRRDPTCKTCNPGNPEYANAVNCPLWDEMYDTTSHVASVQAYAGDSALGRHQWDGVFIGDAPTFVRELLAAYDDAVARLDRMAGLASSASQCLNRNYTDELALHDAITKALDDWAAVSATRARIMARVEDAP